MRKNKIITGLAALAIGLTPNNGKTSPAEISRIDRTGDQLMVYIDMNGALQTYNDPRFQLFFFDSNQPGEGYGPGWKLNLRVSVEAPINSFMPWMYPVRATTGGVGNPGGWGDMLNLAWSDYNPISDQLVIQMPSGLPSDVSGDVTLETYELPVGSRGDEIRLPASTYFLAYTRMMVAPDYNQDNSVDLRDFQKLQQCFSGESPGYYESGHVCSSVYDYDRDSDVDSADYSEFEKRMTGPDLGE